MDFEPFLAVLAEVEVPRFGGVGRRRRIPSSSAVISVKGLIEEPGWRRPWVARLNGVVSKSLPPTRALIAGFVSSMTTIEAVAGSPPRYELPASSAASCSFRSSVDLTLSPPKKAFCGAVFFD